MDLGGNQREVDRARNAKKQQAGKKKQEGNPTKRLEAQAEIMRAKQRAADEKKANGGAKKSTQSFLVAIKLILFAVLCDNPSFVSYSFWN
ncbi:uncharacterized protein SOCG_02372 [Schizosaccharomyces octosporus yFS286]|uniref:Small EDRK-rich factor-like N-terminal domain-containing protein n=1 Tax=Schizosaccharomyces octosporus (strain yFS286) TaxID=483514 RepID=S9Q465_SCHOY|nr:uncharacterized protein SOCG_02372 [Schizosaccharomyces octosporus yFS286]EPX74892.1 hypothetical protein SOCG_02372 [Schizosaccharomyces octosporus yFS286]